LRVRVANCWPKPGIAAAKDSSKKEKSKRHDRGKRFHREARCAWVIRENPQIVLDSQPQWAMIGVQPGFCRIMRRRETFWRRVRI
jgi:hypothetical protein